MTVGDLLDGAFRLVIANWRRFLGAAAIFVVPVQLLSNYFARDMLALDLRDVFAFDDPAAVETLEQLGGGGIVMAVGLVNAFVIWPLGVGALTWLAARGFLGREADVRSALKAMGRRAWALLMAWWLVLIGGSAAFALVIGVSLAIVAAGAAAIGPVGAVLGVLLLFGLLLVAAGAYALFVLVPAVIMVEQRGPFAALVRSAGLVRRRYLAVLGVVVLAGLVLIVVQTGLTTLPSLFAFALGSFGWVLAAAGSIIASTVVLAFVASLVTLLYFDGRIRHEALDLQLTAGELGERGGGVLA